VTKNEFKESYLLIEVQSLVKTSGQVETTVELVAEAPGSGKILKTVGKLLGKAAPILETTSNVMEYANGDISGQRLLYRSTGVGTSI